MIIVFVFDPTFSISHFCSADLFQDGNGTIENEELRGFLKDLLELVKKVRGRENTG